jgi:hypothetical protein
MRTILLKLGATCLTLGATVLSAAYVTSHLKNPAAPLRPAVLASTSSSNLPAPGGSLTVGPSVQPANVPPVTATYAS